MAVKFISEVASNHHQDLERCFQFIDTSSRIGCDAVKFQLFKVEELFSKEVFKVKPEVKKRKQWELPVSFLPDLAARCRDQGIQFGVTPFYLKAVDELYPYVDFYKIASYELLWNDLLKICAQTEKPVVLSTGMATMDEISRAVSTLQAAGCQKLTVLHCVSGYPAPPAQCNLAAIETLWKTFNTHIPNTPSTDTIDIGWSDHSVNPGVIYRAIYRWGANMIEFHLDLEGQGEEYKTGHCWLPDRINEVIDVVKEGIKADGNGIKRPVASEQAERDWRTDPVDGLRPMQNIRKKLE